MQWTRLINCHTLIKALLFQLNNTHCQHVFSGHNILTAFEFMWSFILCKFWFSLSFWLWSCRGKQRRTQRIVFVSVLWEDRTHSSRSASILVAMWELCLCLFQDVFSCLSSYSRGRQHSFFYFPQSSFPLEAWRLHQNLACNTTFPTVTVTLPSEPLLHPSRRSPKATPSILSLPSTHHSPHPIGQQQS